MNDAIFKPLISFATPILTGTFKNVEKLNDQLKKTMLLLEEQKYVNASPLHTTLGNTFDSRADFFNQTEYSEVVDIRDKMHGVLVSWIRETYTLTNEQLNSYIFDYESWFHITRFGGTKTLHNHGQFSWAMVYYVDAGDPPDFNHPLSGYLQLYDPRRIYENSIDQGFSNQKQIFASGCIPIKPESGKFVIFPGYLEHEVLTYWGDKPRIMIAANCCIKKRT